MENEVYEFKAIGHVKSWYKSKNGTPRQASICPEAKGVVELNKTFFDKPHLSLLDLDQFSHIWILFYFNQNTNKKVHSKVKPPRLDGSKTGLFATRSPHRPNPIGLSLTKLDKIDQNLIYVSGLDILDGTPVLDIKPYISDYDYPKMICELNLQDLNNKPNWISCKGVEPKKREVRIASRSKLPTIDLNDLIELGNDGEVKLTSECKTNEHGSDLMELDEVMKKLEISSSQLEVMFTARSERQLRLFHCKDSDEHNGEHLIKDPAQVKNFYLNHSKNRASQASKQKLGDTSREESDRTAEKGGESAGDQDGPTKEESGRDQVSRSLKCKYCLEFLSGTEEAKRALINTLVHDPRSAYRRSRGTDKLYYFTLDTMHITAWFDEEDQTVEVIKIKPNYL